LPISIFIDGDFYSKEEAKISVFDHCLLYGDGIFEGIRLYDKCVFRLREHLERLYSSAKYIAMKIPLTLEEMLWIVAESCRRNDLVNGYIRLVITRGVGDLGLSPMNCKVPSVICIADKIALYPQEAYAKGLNLVSVPTQRMPASAMNPRVKSCNYLNNILAKVEGQNAGAMEVLMLNSDGFAVECSGDNIFIIKKGVIRTPPAYLGALEGVTRNSIIEIARKAGYKVEEEPFTRFEIFDADECFMTGTAAEVVPVVGLDARPIADGMPGPVTKWLTDEFRRVMLDADIPAPTRFAEIWGN
jgi:branched-chain amino acid aminotransferase